MLRTHALPLVLLTLVAGSLLTWRLGAFYLWQDEAQTAVLGERLFQHGRPLAYDGRNLVTMDSFALVAREALAERTSNEMAALRHLVAEHDFKPDGTWINHPWGQFVVAGASLRWLGHGTVQARLPFALAGLVTVLLLYRLVWAVFRQRAMAILAASLLVGNVFWLMNARQCRYYALSSLGLLLTVMAFLRWRRGARGGAVTFVLAAWLYFQADFGSFVPALAALTLLAVAASWPRPGRALLGFAALAATVAPWAWYYQLGDRLRAPDAWAFSRALGILYNVNRFVLAFTVLAAAMVLLRRAKASLLDEARLCLWAAIVVIVGTTLWVPIVAPSAFHRYVVQLAPLGALVAAWVLVRLTEAIVARWGRPRLAPWLMALAGLVEVGTPLTALPVAAGLGLLPFQTPDEHAWRFELPAMARELFTEPSDPNRLVIEAIAPRLQPGDEVLVNYEDYPFIFYTNARVRGGVAAFRVEDPAGAPPRFAILRNVPWTHWPAFARAMAGSEWRRLPIEAPDRPWGHLIDPTRWPYPTTDRRVYVVERVTAERPTATGSR